MMYQLQLIWREQSLHHFMQCKLEHPDCTGPVCTFTGLHGKRAADQATNQCRGSADLHVESAILDCSGDSAPETNEVDLQQSIPHVAA